MLCAFLILLSCYKCGSGQEGVGGGEHQVHYCERRVGFLVLCTEKVNQLRQITGDLDNGQRKLAVCLGICGMVAR